MDDQKLKAPEEHFMKFSTPKVDESYLEFTEIVSMPAGTF